MSAMREMWLQWERMTAAAGRRALFAALLGGLGAAAVGGAGCQIEEDYVVPSPPPLVEWETLKILPQTNGVAGAFGGLSNNTLIVAGGANFPNGAPWEGGEKVWHDRIYALSHPRAQWQVGNWRLPRPLGYGVSVSTPDGLVCIGGGDKENHYKDVFILQWKQGRVVRHAMPELPKPMAFGFGALVDQTIYVMGGLEAPDSVTPLADCWKMDLSRREQDRTWESVPAFPGKPRILAVAAGHGGAFFVFSGVTPAAGSDGAIRDYLTDAYRYTPEDGWVELAEMPRPAAAAPSPAHSLTPGLMMIASGDSGEHFGANLNYAHPGFSKSVLFYLIEQDLWEMRREFPQRDVIAPVTAAAARWLDGYVVVSGEARPGIRTPQVLFCRPWTPPKNLPTPPIE